MTKTNEIATKTEQVELASPQAVLEFANQLKKLIVDNHLYTDIKGKNYVNVEGWQIAGAFIGISPTVEVVENLSQGTFYKYRAEVSLRDKEGNKVGYGVAICTNKEAGKHNFDEYAVCSMAQTRAIGKAYRMRIGWLLKVAGYETTPAEEMDAVMEANIEKPKKMTFSMREVSYAMDSLEQAKTIDDLKAKFNALGDIKKHAYVIAKKDEMKARLQGVGDE